MMTLLYLLRLFRLLLAYSAFSFVAFPTTALDTEPLNTGSRSLLSEQAPSLSPPLSTNSYTSNNVTFLPVDEAYQLSVRLTEAQLIAEWIIAKDYFLYGEQFRFSNDTKTLAASLPPGKVSYDTTFEKNVEKHYLYLQATLDRAQLPKDQTSHLSVRYQGCADAGLCYPPETRQFVLDLIANTATPLSSNTTVQGVVGSAKNSQAPSSLWLFATMLLAAMAGGALLNLMPCVFPVLSIKALSLAQNTQQRSRIHHGWSYTLGCLITFVLIASLLLVIRGAGQAVGWGFQLQSPSVITFLTLLFFVMGLSLSGLVTVGTQWMNTGQALTEGQGIKQSFFTGVLATVVASPCTAPLMATALGYALTQTTPIALGIFAALGFGMAAPFLLLSYWPRLGRYLPQPGAWMDTFKQALAFPLYLTSAWLLWVLGHQIGHNSVILVILGAIAIVFVFWLGHRKPQWSQRTLLVASLIIAGIIWSNQQQPTIQDSTSQLWQPYSKERLSSLRQQGEAVFVNLTADWCITCKVNEKLVFTTSTLEQMKAKGIHLLEGDWTNNNPEITALLDQYSRAGVPLYLLFPPRIGAEAKILPQLLNPLSFKQEIDKL